MAVVRVFTGGGSEKTEAAKPCCLTVLDTIMAQANEPLLQATGDPVNHEDPLVPVKIAVKLYDGSQPDTSTPDTPCMAFLIGCA